MFRPALHLDFLLRIRMIFRSVTNRIRKVQISSCKLLGISLRFLGLIWIVLPSVGSGLAIIKPAIRCEKKTFEQKNYTICQTNPGVLGQPDEVGSTPILRTYLNDSNGKVYGGFRALRDDLDSQGFSLIFAVNGGMYHPDRSAVGYYVENQIKIAEVNTQKGHGNFHLMPNGIFFIGSSADRNAMTVMESKAFLSRPQQPDFATQSGPMLVIDGQIHHRFVKDSINRRIRNGVGVRGKVVFFVNSDEPVNFFEFAQVFNEHLEISNALYLDGTISSLYHPPTGRHDKDFPLGPIIAIVKPRNRTRQN